MGTTSEGGTTERDMIAGIKKYLESHGLKGWKVEHGKVTDHDDLGSIAREFKADGEDVILYLVDIVDGDTLGHFVTMGSVGSYTWHRHYEEICVSGISYRIDFMDPAGGGSPDSLRFDVSADSLGRPILHGYKLHEEKGHDARIAGYIVVSPPDDGSEGGENSLSIGLRSNGGWIDIDSGPATGFGQPDTLWWNTGGFSGSTYLLQVSIADTRGNVTTAIKLTGIPQFITGLDDFETPDITARIKHCYPNPFNPSTTIEYSVSKETRITLSIYDIAGRRVRQLISGSPVEAGDHRVIWDGRNDRGRPMASGVYFCRLKTKESVSAIKIILLR
jgi:hypothetical protein